MHQRQLAIALIQALSAEEGMRQPSAADWLREQDRRQQRPDREALEGRMRLAPWHRRFPLAAP